MEEEEFTAVYWLERGKNHLDKEEYEVALECFDKSLQLKPKYPLVWYYKALALEKTKKEPEALEFLRKINVFNIGFNLYNNAKDLEDRIRLTNEITYPIKKTSLLSTIEIKIRKLREPYLIACVGAFTLMGFITATISFLVKLSVHLFDIGLLILAIVFAAIGFGWFLVRSKFDESANIHLQIYREIKKMQNEQEERGEKNNKSSSGNEEQESI